jgi:hypothetical protein
MNNETIIDFSTPEKDKSLEGVKLFVSSPTYGHVSMYYLRALLELQSYCNKLKLPIMFHILQSSLVTQGRNQCVSSFLDSPCTHMLFIDADIEFDEKSVVTMIKADKDIVLTPYPMKFIDWDKAEQLREQSKRPLKDSGYYFPIKMIDPDNIVVENGLCEIKAGPTGFMLIKRQVFDKMIKEYPHLKIEQKTMLNSKPMDYTNMYNFFDTYYNPEDKSFMGEDFAFCKRWKDIGGKIYANTDAYITHHGDYAYKGRFIDEAAKIE